MKINKVAIIGFGSIGKRHFEILKDLLPHSEIAILTRKKLKKIPDGAKYNYTKIEEILDFNPQLAVIANPATQHISVASLLVSEGINLLIEKPISTSSKGLKDFIRLTKKYNPIIAVGYNLRFLPSLIAFKDFLLNSRKIGEIYSIRAEVGQYLPSWRSDKDYQKSVSAQKDLGGGVMFELSHEIDYLRWILGEIKSIQARCMKKSSLNIDVEDIAHMIIEFAPNEISNGVFANLTIDFIRHDSTRVVTAIGEKGSLRWNGINGTIELFKVGNNNWQRLFSNSNEIEDSYYAEWNNLIDSIENQSSLETPFTDAIKTLEVIEAAFISNEKKIQINLLSD